jgi:thymidylate kinase
MNTHNSAHLAGLRSDQTQDVGCAENTETADNRRARMLSAVFEVLDRAGVRYCLSHGYENFPEQVTSDVDCILEDAVSPSDLVALLGRNRDKIGGEPVQCHGSYLVLAGADKGSGPVFLHLDFSAHAAVDAVAHYTASEILATRRRSGQFWVPASDLAFGIRLTRSIAKGRLDADRWAAMGSLYRQDSTGCGTQVRRFWTGRNAEIIAVALTSGDLAPLEARLPDLQAELRWRSIARRPAAYFKGLLGRQAGRVGRLLRPGGVYVALLGPDGAGKSSTIEALESRMAGAFARSECYGFTPAVVHKLRHGGYRPNAIPHALPPRSFVQSVARAVLYWGGYYTLGYAVRHLDLARTTLVLNDRHFVDVLVDPVRYRYGGPSWLVQAIWRCIPKPDLILLLDAPAEVLQSRKQEVPFEETARQRQAYAELVGTLRNGHIIPCARPLDVVAADASNLVLQHLAARLSRRHGVARSSPAAFSTTDRAVHLPISENA